MSNLHVESLAIYYQSVARWCYDIESSADFYHLRPRYEDVCYLAMIAPHTGGIIEKRALKNRELADAIKKYSKPYDREKGWSNCKGILTSSNVTTPVEVNTTPVAEKMFDRLFNFNAWR